MTEDYFLPILQQVENESEKELSSFMMRKLRDVLRYIDKKEEKRIKKALK